MSHGRRQHQRACSPIIALINQAQSDRLESELKPFSPFFAALADKLSAVLASYSAGSIKCFGIEVRS